MEEANDRAELELLEGWSSLAARGFEQLKLEGDDTEEDGTTVAAGAAAAAAPAEPNGHWRTWIGFGRMGDLGPAREVVFVRAHSSQGESHAVKTHNCVATEVGALYIDASVLKEPK